MEDIGSKETVDRLPVIVSGQGDWNIDLQLIKNIDSYKDVSATVSGIAMKKFLGHLWYLSEELSALAFFDDDVPDDTKRKMVLSLQNPGAEHPLNRITLEPSSVKTKQLEDI